MKSKDFFHSLVFLPPKFMLCDYSAASSLMWSIFRGVGGNISLNNCHKAKQLSEVIGFGDNQARLVFKWLKKLMYPHYCNNPIQLLTKEFKVIFKNSAIFFICALSFLSVIKYPHVDLLYIDFNRHSLQSNMNIIGNCIIQFSLPEML